MTHFPKLSIGHVHLKVADLDRSIAFYTQAIGLEVMQRMGDRAAFLSSDGYHHHLGLNTWHSLGQPRAPKHAPGLFHTAFLYPDREGLARAYKRALDHGVQIEGAADHGVSEAIYFSDPDGNGIEIYRDRERKFWPLGDDGTLEMVNSPLDLDLLLAEAG
ncbi:MAG: VOC family protein [Litoreibacter sp.]|nr:VOC family protein [Litoreibacter sp.]